MKIWTYPKVLTIIVIIMLGIFTGILYSGYNSEWFQRKYICPFPYQEIVYHHALEYNLSPFLIAGVIKVESSFKPDARSPKGAQGLMQIMPATGKWVAEKLNYENYADDNLDSESILNEPAINIWFGSWYLDYLKKEFADNEVLYLAAYNGGIGNVKEWMTKYGWEKDFSDIDQIPFPETKNYVKRVLYYKEMYQDIYGR